MRFVKSIDIQFSKIKIKGSFFNPELFCTVSITNPTSFTVTIDAIKGNVFYQKNNIAYVESLQAIPITANQAIQTEIKIIPTVSSAINLIGQFLSGSIANEFYFVGHAYVTGIPISINQKIGS